MFRINAISESFSSANLTEIGFYFHKNLATNHKNDLTKRRTKTIKRNNQNKNKNKNSRNTIDGNEKPTNDIKYPK